MHVCTAGQHADAGLELMPWRRDIQQ